MGREEARHPLDGPRRRLVQCVRRENRRGPVLRHHERQRHVEGSKQAQPQRDRPRDLGARTAHLAISHHGMKIAEGQMGARDQHWQQHGRAGADETTVHVAAVGPGSPCANRLAVGRRADAPYHGSQRESHRGAEQNFVPFDRQYATFAGVNSAPQHPAILKGHGPRAGRHLDLTDLDQQGVAGFSAGDVDRPRHRHAGRVLELLVESFRGRADVSRDRPVGATVQIHRDMGPGTHAGRRGDARIVVSGPVLRSHVYRINGWTTLWHRDRPYPRRSCPSRVMPPPPGPATRTFPPSMVSIAP